MRLELRGSTLSFERGRPRLMGIVNATPDSFSDRQGPKGLDELVERAHRLVAEGAEIIDVGGESGRTDRHPVTETEEAGRIVPLVERLVADDITVSVDTWRAGPARAALGAGAAMVNDVSGLADPAVAELCAEHRAGLVITHTRAAPKVEGLGKYEDVVADVIELLRYRARAARDLGVPEDSLLLDPGLDLAKTPHESLQVLRRLPELEELRRPLLLAISRKDFVGALTGRPPANRGAGTLGAIEPALAVPGAVLRVHDVAAAADFVRVRRALLGVAEEHEVHPAGRGARTQGAVRPDRGAEMANIEKSIEVDAPIAAVYDQWTQFEEFPSFMEGVEEIRQVDDKHVHWTVEFGGTRHEWDAEITEQKPEERVAWRNVDGKDNAGVVTFHRIDDDTTRVMVQMDWAPEGIKEKLGASLNFDERRVEGDLGRFKELIESQSGATGSWRGEVSREG